MCFLILNLFFPLFIQILIINASELELKFNISTSTNGGFSRKIGVLGAPFGKGQPIPGVELGPKFCRDTGFINIIRSDAKQDIVDYGDISFEEEIGASETESNPKCITKPCPTKNVKEVASASKKISSQVKKILEDKRISLTLGGDHTISIGTIDATSTMYNGDIGILYLDAHADINTPDSSPTGNMHGMDLSFVIKEMKPFLKEFQEFSWLKPKISASNLVYIATRDYDPPVSFSKEFIKTHNITNYNMNEVRKHGIEKIIQQALKKLSGSGLQKRPIHVSFDIDSIDPKFIKTTGTTANEGLTLDDGITIMKEVYKSSNLVALDLTEINPKLGNSEDRKKASNVIKALLLNAFGCDQ